MVESQTDTDVSTSPPEAAPRKTRLSDKVGVVFFGTAGGFLVHLLWGMALVRMLDKGGVGTYRQVWLVYGIASVIFQLGIPASISYFVPQLSPRRGLGLALQVFATMLALGVLMSLTLFFGATLLAHRLGNPELAPLLRIFAPYPLFFLPFTAASSLLIVQNRHRQAALLQFITSAQGPAISWALLAAGYTLHTCFGALVVTAAALFAGMTVWLLRLCRRVGVEWRHELISQQMRYSLPIGLASAIDTLGRRLDQVVISLFYPPSQFAIYTVGAFEVPIFALLTASMASVLTPEFVRWLKEGNVEQLLRVWHRAVMKMGLVILPTVVGLFVAAPLVVSIFYTKAYQESTLLFRIYLFVMLVRVTQYSMILRAAGRTSVIFWASLGYLTANLVLGVTLVKLIGFAGPAIASVTGYYFYVWLLLRQVSKALGVPLKRVMPWWGLARAAAVACVAVAPAWPLLLLPVGEAFRLAAFIIGYALVYTLLGLLTRVVTREDLALLGRWGMLRPAMR